MTTTNLLSLSSVTLTAAPKVGYLYISSCIFTLVTWIELQEPKRCAWTPMRKIASREFAALTDREFEQTYWGPAWRMGRCRPRCRQSDWSPSVSAPAVSSAWCGDGGKRRSSRRWSAASTASRTLQSKQEVATHRTQGSLSWGQTWIECTNCIGIVKKCFDYCHRKIIYVIFFQGLKACCFWPL